MKSAIELINVKKQFGDKVVLSDINLSIEKGKSLVIIGGSGCGKSVLIKSVIGILLPTSGKVIVNGQDITFLQGNSRSGFMSRIGVLFQGGALFDSLKVWQNVAFSLLHNRKMNKKEAYKIAVEKLASVGLKEDVAMLYPAELSGGMQKRASLARAIATNPEIIFFDEPTTGLDPIMTDVINELIIEASETLKATTVTITHDMASVRKIADKVAMLHQGKILWQGSVKEMEKTNNPYILQFINGKSEGPISY